MSYFHERPGDDVRATEKSELRRAKARRIFEAFAGCPAARVVTTTLDRVIPEILVDMGALRGLVSGSGPTCVFLCESADHARSVAGALTAADEQRVVLVAHGPVAGAHVVADA